MKAIPNYTSLLKEEIKQTINAYSSGSKNADTYQLSFLSRLLPYATTGKLLRGCLVCFSYEAFSGKKPDHKILQAAAALELVHSALLIHDDIMDDDDFRRGKPSMHKQYAEVARKQKFSEPDRFGVNMAICGADMCLFIAISILSKQTASITGLYSDMLIKVCGGQMQDILLQARPRNPPRSDIYKLMRAKTASYTLSLPLMAGASLSGQPQVVINKLCRFGEAAGVIFQIRDDELGVIGDTEKTGKPVGADIREGKQTLISYYLLKACGASERRQLRAVLGNQNITAGDIAWVQGLIKKHGVSQMINEEIRYLERKASIALETIDISSQNQKELKSLLAFCAKRKT